MKPNKHVQDLHKLLTDVKTPQEMALVLDDLLTPQELYSIAERLQIIQALLKNEPQRDIATRLDTSIGKITRGSRVVQFGKVDWKKYIKS